MKKMLMLVTLFVVSNVTFAGGKVIGNGGDSRALDFYNTALASIKKLKSNEALYPEIKGIDLEAILDKAEILVSEVPVYSFKGQINQFSTVINFKNPDTIVVYGPKWNDIKNKSIKSALALHEVLSLAEIEETGVYQVSQRFLGASGIECASGLCENLPRYSCSFHRMSYSSYKQEKMGAGKIGYVDSGSELVNIEASDMKATITMKTRALNSEIVLTLLQNGKTVGVSELQGTHLPNSLQLRWKDTVENVAWTLSCQQD